MKKATKPSRKQLSPELAGAAKQLLDLSLAGAVLESVAEFLVSGRSGSSLKKVIEHAERRLQEQAWRKRIAGML
jgi:hypothetical protein